VAGRSRLATAALIALPLLAAGPPVISAAAEPPTTATSADAMEEVIVTGRRGPRPSFQEEYEFHKAEYERLAKLFEPPNLDRPPSARDTGPESYQRITGRDPGLMPSPNSNLTRNEPTPLR
jgi:hypothetical protein